MNNNLEFENEDPSPDSIEDNHPRTNYGEGYGGKETLEEAAEDFANSKKWMDGGASEWVQHIFKEGAKWQQERSQSIVPFDAYNIEVFAIKPDEQGKLFAYIGYKISNGNFHFNVVPFSEQQSERMYSLEEISKDFVGEGTSGGYFDDFLDHRIETGNKITFKEWFEQFKKK